MVKPNSLYNQVVEATSIYLGAAAERFVIRLIVGHLDKSPEKLKKQDLGELIKWVKPAMGLLTADVQITDHYLASLDQLRRKSRES